MAKAPETPRPARRRSRRTTRKTKSVTGRVISAATGVAAAAGVYTELAVPTEPAPIVCGGTERWPVKVANDKDAITNKIDLNPAGPFTVPQINQQMLPGAYPSGGRMEVEKKVYTVRGYLSYFKQEKGAKGDRDYHVVITDQPGGYDENEQAAPNGKSMVIEFPDPNCFAGKAGLPASPSPLTQAVVDARATFESHIKWPAKTKLTEPIPVTVTGVGFFDFDHHQEGRATPHPGTTGSGKVFELHPVTEIVFDNATDEI